MVTTMLKIDCTYSHKYKPPPVVQLWCHEKAVTQTRGEFFICNYFNEEFRKDLDEVVYFGSRSLLGIGMRPLGHLLPKSNKNYEKKERGFGNKIQPKLPNLSKLSDFSSFCTDPLTHKMLRKSST